MLKNIFIESCVLSALIFGGFYLNAAHLKNEISVTQETYRNQSQDESTWNHISGLGVAIDDPENIAHLSGSKSASTPVPPISGADQPPLLTGK